MSEDIPQLIYRPPGTYEPSAEKATLAVKFANDIFLTKSFLDKKKIEYKEEDLEDTPLGPCIRLRKAKDENLV
jgi:hypothetical protein